MPMKKSPRHSKITGDFAEGLVLYWLSKYDYECARIDHVGIDLIARHPVSGELMGISVKCRSRYEGTEKTSINLPTDGFDKAAKACDAFGLHPYYAIVVDGAAKIRGYLLPLAHLQFLATGAKEGMRYWQMNDKYVRQYEFDPKIERFELATEFCSWGNGATKNGPTAD